MIEKIKLLINETIYRVGEEDFQETMSRLLLISSLLENVDGVIMKNESH